MATDLHLLIDKSALRADPTLPAQQALYRLLRDAIMDKRLPGGSVLPASRVLAADLGIARNCVLYAYEQLGAEGYVQATRQGTVVAALALPARRAASGVPPSAAGLSTRAGAVSRRRTAAQDRAPFMPGVPALDAFPLQAWARAVSTAQRSLEREALGYREPAGEPELRQAVATYLGAARGVRCGAEQVVITMGSQHSLELCAALLADVGDVAWMEHPGYGAARVALQMAGLRLQPVTVDAQGINPPAGLWGSCPPRLIYTTPSHQYPLGSVLSLERRLALIEQARRHQAWILEDDYDSEFRHDGPPLAAMQGLVESAPVVYLGTFSKSMFPSLRLGFVVLPASLADAAVASLSAWVRGGQVVPQRALAAFIEDGSFTAHLRRMRQLYRARQDALREALRAHWPWPFEVLGGSCGMHLVVTLPPQVRDATLAEQALRAGLGARPLSAYSSGGIAGFNGLVLGYANTPQAEMAAQVRALVRSFGSS